MTAVACAGLLVGAADRAAARQGVQPSPWEAEVQAFERADRVSPAPRGGILFTGSSSIRLWTTLADDFPALPVLNRGVGGSQIHEVTALADRLVLPYRPRLVILYCGSNDVFLGRPAAQVVADFEIFVSRLHGELPDTRIAFMSVAPNPARWALQPQFTQVNDAIAAYAAEAPLVDYIDVATRMLGADGLPRPDIFVDDRLHMNERGYRLWTTIIGEYLQRVEQWKVGQLKWVPLADALPEGDRY